MLRRFTTLLLLFMGFTLFAQTPISGYLDTENFKSGEKVYLTKINLKDFFADNVSPKPIEKLATATLSKNGFFQFKKSLISDKEAIYRLHVERFEKALKDTFQVDQLFILSGKDTIQFKKSKIPFAEYSTTNIADREWQKLRRFEHQLRKENFSKEDSLSDAYVANLKTYAKDSLEILMVKLIGIKQLDYKKLLEKDIAKNPDYYIALLSQLKESDIERSEYLFLENKLAFLTTEVAKQKYATSKMINMLLVLVIMVLITVVFYIQKAKNQNNKVDLSRQENNIKGLILEGKTNKEIANELFISLSTVKTHITNIYSKLKVSNRQELLRKMQN